MPHIMLTYRCNLHCSYCFANEFVNKEKTDITVRNFRKAVEFLTRTGETHIGLIGGEPTLHPVFQLLMEMMIANPKVSGITLFTNGLLLDQFIPQITHPKVKLLVNCNSPLIIGEKSYDRMRSNLDTLIWQYYMKDRVHLGINLYSIDMDYTYIMELLQRYKMHNLRISVSVPDFSSCSESHVLEYFRKHKEFLLEFFRKMDSIQVMPYYDCNNPPYCIWNDEEKKWLEAYAARHPKYSTNLVGHCFGMSDFTKVNIDDFRSIQDLTKFFLDEIDACAHKLSACDECKNCYERKTHNCVAGCMGFKASRIRACNEAIERL